MKSFLPEGYEAPKSNSSGYMKLQDGANKFRILSEAITGYVVWTTDKKPVRSRDYPKSLPANVEPDTKVRHFWAFVVWNYRANEIVNADGSKEWQGDVQILEITQATIRDQIHEYYKMAEYGEPTGYDIVINKKGEKLSTEYSVQALPPKAMPNAAADAYKAKTINLNALFDGGNPFDDTGEAAYEKFEREQVGGDEEAAPVPVSARDFRPKSAK